MTSFLAFLKDFGAFVVDTVLPFIGSVIVELITAALTLATVAVWVAVIAGAASWAWHKFVKASTTTINFLPTPAAPESPLEKLARILAREASEKIDRDAAKKAEADAAKAAAAAPKRGAIYPPKPRKRA